MRFKLASLVFIASCLPAMAGPTIPIQGNIALVSGRAHVTQGASGTYIHIAKSAAGPAVSGLIPFGNQSQYPDLRSLEGRMVAISGVIIWDGRCEIILTDPDQLSVS